MGLSWAVPGVVQPPASIQGLALEIVTDQQLHQWSTQLEDAIGTGSLGERIDTERLTEIDQAITEAEQLAGQMGISRTQRQVQLLEEQRRQVLDQITEREAWIEDHAELLHTYTTVRDELAARTTAPTVSYQLTPPDDVVDALGPRPTNTAGATRWDAAVAHHAAARSDSTPMSYPCGSTMN